jgi:putative ABC transport system permease protein
MLQHWTAMDFRSAWRGLSRTPAFSLLVIGTLALGIGATTTMFSIVWAVFLRPLPLADQGRLVTIWESDAQHNEPQRRLTPANFADWEARATSFEALGALPNWSGSPWFFNVAGPSGFDRVQGIYASSGFFRVMGISPLLGRVLDRDDDRTRGRRTVVISHGLWQSRFGGDRAIVGRTLEVDTYRGGPFTIVGVMPSEFDFPRGAQLWLSLADWGGGPMPLPGDANRCCAWYTTFGKLKSGVTREHAASELATIARRVSADYTQGAQVTDVRILPLRETLVASHRTTLFVLFGAVICILLIGCANVANLLLARAVARRREVATRLALGATRSRIARQFLAESLLLGVSGAGLGLVLSLWAQELIASTLTERVPLIEQVRFDWMVFAFAMGLTLATSLACGLTPLVTSRHMSWESRGRGQTENRESRRLRQALVVGEIAVAVAVVTIAGLLVRTVAKLRAVDVGFDTSQTLVISTDLSTSPLRDRGSAASYVADLVPRITRLPGVRVVAAATGTPLLGSVATQAITRQDEPVRSNALSPHVVHTAVTPDYFSAMGMVLKRGRVFAESDGANDALVAMINETAARRYWPGEDPIGKRFAIGSVERFGSFRPVRTGEIEWREIIGVVSDVRSAGFAFDIQPEVYYNYRQFPLYNAVLFVRAANDPLPLIPPIRREMASLNNRAVITQVQTLEDVANQSIADQVLRAALGSVFSLLAMLLGMCGIYGVMTYSVVQRTREIGIRLALGAERAAVARMVLAQALRLSIIGLGLGVVAAFVVARWISSLLFGVTGTDAPTLAATCLLLLSAALAASAVPTHRALSVEPTVALRED